MPVLIGDGFVQKLAQRAPSICEIVDQQSVSWNLGFHLCGLTLGSWTSTIFWGSAALRGVFRTSFLDMSLIHVFEYYNRIVLLMLY